MFPSTKHDMKKTPKHIFLNNHAVFKLRVENSVKKIENKPKMFVDRIQ